MHDSCDVHEYSSADIEERCRLKPHSSLPTDRKTSITGEVTPTGNRHAASFVVSISPQVRATHTHFICKHVFLSFCCVSGEELLKNEVIRKIQRLIEVDFPQVGCDVRKVPRFDLRFRVSLERALTLLVQLVRIPTSMANVTGRLNPSRRHFKKTLSKQPFCARLRRSQKLSRNEQISMSLPCSPSSLGGPSTSTGTRSSHKLRQRWRTSIGEHSYSTSLLELSIDFLNCYRKPAQMQVLTMPISKNGRLLDGQQDLVSLTIFL